MALLDATEFDGSTDFFTRGTLDGVSDSKKFILSVWFKLDGSSNNGSDFALLGTSPGFVLDRFTNNKMSVFAIDSSFEIVVDAFSNSTFINTDTSWHHILVSMNTATSDLWLYIDDVDEKAVGFTLLLDGIIDFTQPNWDVGSLGGGEASSLFHGCLSQVYMSIGESLDLDIIANRRKFINASLEAVYLGTDGSIPTGTQPQIFLPNPFGTFGENQGSGGNFTENGSVIACADGPPLAPHELAADNISHTQGLQSPAILSGTVISLASKEPDNSHITTRRDVT